VARGAAAAGTIHVASSVSGHTLEEIAAIPGPKWFQLYSFFSRERMENLVGRAQASGYRAMVVTVDTPVSGRREKDVRNGHGGGTGDMRVNTSNAIRRAPQLLPRPAWVIRYIRDGMPFGAVNTAQMSADGKPLLLSQIGAGETSMSPTWDDITWIREAWKRPLLVKGILTADDARRSVELGCDGVIVSNHGGRQLEDAPATLDVLSEIVAAVGDETTVLLDGGVRRGGDVLKAVARGAQAILIGRPYVWGLAIGGQAGVEHMLALFHSELVRSMQLMGCHSVEQLDFSWVSDIGQIGNRALSGDSGEANAAT
jgi:L-lactate dehydrogenase (cytochrome)